MKRKITVEGMHCSSCEEKIEKALSKIKGISQVKANAGKGIVLIECEENHSTNKLKKAIKDNGFTYITDEKYTDKFSKLRDIVLTIIFFALFLNISNIYTPTFNENAQLTLYLVFSFGLLNSLHCMGMCGSILMPYLISSTEDKKAGTYYYIIGRVISYTTIGALLGLLGGTFAISDTIKAYILIIGSLIMVLMALKMIGIIKLPKLKIINLKVKPGKSMLVIGLLNGLMPCGPLQIMQLYALASGNMLSGAIIMLVFSIATSIALLILGLTSSKLKFFKGKNFKYIGFVIIAIISFNLFNQGIMQYRTANSINKNELSNFTTTIEEDVEYQEVTLKVDGYYYFSEKIIESNKPVKINIESKRLDGCNNPAKFVTPSGEVFEIDFTKYDYIIYTPKETGRLQIICWMNMRYGSIRIA